MPNGPYEDRPNWAALFRRKKAESWMSDYSGVVVLAEQPGVRWWVNVWRNEDKAEVFLSLAVKEKTDQKTKPYKCDLRHVRGGHHYGGELLLGDAVYKIRVFRAPTRDRAIYLQCQFELIASPALAGQERGK